MSTARVPHDYKLFSGSDYHNYSEHQYNVGMYLLSRVSVHPEDRILDIGCGDGRLTLEIAEKEKDVSVTGIDASPSMIETARKLLREHPGYTIKYITSNLMEFSDRVGFDLVFSSSTLHWIRPLEKAYRKIFELLKPGGRLAAQQSGCGFAKEFGSCALQVAKDMGYASYFKGWESPLAKPTAEELFTVVESAGFSEIEVISNYRKVHVQPSHVLDWSVAGFLTYLEAVPREGQDRFKEAFIESAKSCPALTINLLFVFARKLKKLGTVSEDGKSK
jgi:trans-aconitate methyltransferase